MRRCINRGLHVPKDICLFISVKQMIIYIIGTIRAKIGYLCYGTYLQRMLRMKAPGVHYQDSLTYKQSKVRSCRYVTVHMSRMAEDETGFGRCPIIFYDNKSR